MDHYKKSLANLSVLFLVVVGLIYLSLSSLGPIVRLPTLSSLVHDTYDPIPMDELGRALRKAATADGTVILTVINNAYTEMLDLFLESFWIGEGTRRLLDNVLVVAVDEAAYTRCRFRRLNCYRLETEGSEDFQGEKMYMSEGFVTMMWRRTLFLGEVLKKGYNFVFTDTDVMWLRNPFARLSKNETEDLQISADEFYGDPWSKFNVLNTGFYFVRSNNRTISLFDAWYARKDTATGKKDQDVLLDLMDEGLFRSLGLKVRFLDTDYFSGFCKDSEGLEKVTTVHANCCRSIKAKVFDLSVVLRDWKRFKWRTEGRDSDGWSPHEGCRRAWGVNASKLIHSKRLLQIQSHV